MLTQLQTDLRNISQEAKKNDPELKDAIERALLKIRQNVDSPNEKQIDFITQSPEILKPFLLACERRHTSSVTGLAVGGLHRLISNRAVHKTSVPRILSVLQGLSNSNEETSIQIKLLQCAAGLLTHQPFSLHGEELAQCLLLQFKFKNKANSSSNKLSLAGISSGLGLGSGIGSSLGLGSGGLGLGLESVCSACIVQSIGSIFDKLKEIQQSTSSGVNSNNISGADRKSVV